MHQTAYHPSSSTVGQAQPVSVASGEERSGVDVTLKLVPSATISGQLLGPTGPAESYMLHLTPTDTGEMSTDPDVATAVTAADGSFMFLGVPAGQYVIQTLRVPRGGITGAATMVINQGAGNMSFTTTTMAGAAGPAPPQNSEPTLWTATPVTLGATDVRDLTITLNTGLKISGRTEFQGSAERPPGDRLAQVTVMLESADGRARTGALTSRLQANGLFTTAGVPPGKYLLRVINPPGGWDVRSIMLGGVDASDTPVDLEDKDLAGALITFTDRVSALSGTVKSAQGAADNAAAAVIFPVDSRTWTYNNPRRIRMTRVSKSGTYTFNGLPDGDYFLIAIPEEVASEWQDPRFLDAMSREATRVTMVEGDKRTQDLERRNVRPVEPGRELSRSIAGPDQPSPRLRRSAVASTEAEAPAYMDEASPDDEAEAPAYTGQSTQQQQTRDPRATPARDPAADPVGTGTIAGVVVQDDDVEHADAARARHPSSQRRHDRARDDDRRQRTVFVCGVAGGPIHALCRQGRVSHRLPRRRARGTRTRIANCARRRSAARQPRRSHAARRGRHRHGHRPVRRARPERRRAVHAVADERRRASSDGRAGLGLGDRRSRHLSRVWPDARQLRRQRRAAAAGRLRDPAVVAESISRRP